MRMYTPETSGVPVLPGPVLTSFGPVTASPPLPPPQAATMTTSSAPQSSGGTNWLAERAHEKRVNGLIVGSVNARLVPRAGAVKHASASASRDVGAAAERPSSGGRRALSARTEERHAAPPRFRAQNLSAVPRTR